VLDEPTVGLDPKQIVAIRELIRELGQRHTLLLSTHILPEVELLCDRVMIIDQGRIVAQGTPDSLRQQSLGNTVLRVTIGDGEEAPEVLASLAGVVGVRPQAATGSGAAAKGRWLVECERGRDLREEIFRTAVTWNWVLLELAEERTSLEEIFVRLTASSSADGGVEVWGEPTAEPTASEEEELS
jgi:ABC-2 type transport system ATP-binding protein